jgi:hypothetical protein
LYEAIVTFHIVVPLVFWALLAKDVMKNDSSPFHWWKEVTVHGLDFVIVYLEVFLGRMIMCWSRMYFVILLVLAYLLYALAIQMW